MIKKVPFSLKVYQKLTPFLTGVLSLYLRRRLKKGKEDPHRLKERRGQASQPRPAGSVVWFHGASVGESVSLLPLLEHLRQQFPHITPLVTTGTVTAASLMAKMLPQGCIHQYSPLDVPLWVQTFLAYWRPQMAVFVESELWPNLILSCKKHNIPLYLINGSLSEKSYHFWVRCSALIGYLLSCFEALLVQSPLMAVRFEKLGASPSSIQVCGNLKFAARPLSYDENELKNLNNFLKNRPVWVAASTHSGEEGLIAQAHHLIQKFVPDILTILIPRHPHRREEIEKELAAQNLQVTKRSCQEIIQPSTDIYLVDTMGEIGLFYKLSPIVFLGGTLVPIGGHNPIEAALLDCALIWGPHMHKQKEICDVLNSAAFQVTSPEDLAQTVRFLLADENVRDQKINMAHSLIKSQSHILDKIIHTLQVKLQEDTKL